MSKIEKLIKKILDGNSVITVAEAQKVLEYLNYTGDSPGTSHISYRKEGSKRITLVLTEKELKHYQIKNMQEALKNEGY